MNFEIDRFHVVSKISRTFSSSTEKHWNFMADAFLCAYYYIRCINRTDTCLKEWRQRLDPTMKVRVKIIKNNMMMIYWLARETNTLVVDKKRPKRDLSTRVNL